MEHNVRGVVIQIDDGQEIAEVDMKILHCLFAIIRLIRNILNF